MDIRQFNPTAASDTAQRFDLIDPFTAEPIVGDDDQTLGYSIVGMQSTIATNEDARIRREYPTPETPVEEMTDAEREDWQTHTHEYAMRAINEKLAKMVTELHGTWQDGDKSITAKSKKALAALLEDQQWVATQMLNNASRLKNYRPKM